MLEKIKKRVRFEFIVFKIVDENGSTTNLMENATLVVKRSYVFRTVI